MSDYDRRRRAVKKLRSGARNEDRSFQEITVIGEGVFDGDLADLLYDLASSSSPAKAA